MVIDIKYFDREDYLQGLLGMTHDELWEVAKINLDDWDYGLVLKNHLKSSSSYFKSTGLDRLLTGCCSNEWYEVKSKNGELYTIGMAYHS